MCSVAVVNICLVLTLGQPANIGWLSSQLFKIANFHKKNPIKIRFKCSRTYVVLCSWLIEFQSGLRTSSREVTQSAISFQYFGVNFNKFASYIAVRTTDEIKFFCFTNYIRKLYFSYLWIDPWAVQTSDNFNCRCAFFTFCTKKVLRTQHIRRNSSLTVCKL